jgi:hypothetical protein
MLRYAWPVYILYRQHSHIPSAYFSNASSTNFGKFYITNEQRGSRKNKVKGKLTGVPNPVLGSHPAVTGNPSVPHEEVLPPTTSVKPVWALE